MSVQEVKDEENKHPLRDDVFAQLLKHHSDEFKVRWTVKEMVEAVEGDISEVTVRRALNSWADKNLLKHKSKSDYWYVEPEYF